MENRSICEAPTLLAKPVAWDFQALAEVSEEARSWFPKRKSDISMFKRGTRDWEARAGLDPRILRRAGEAWGTALPEIAVVKKWRLSFGAIGKLGQRDRRAEHNQLRRWCGHGTGEWRTLVFP
eukprot:1391314-Pyramimonas_sp.AAC.1